MIQARLPCAICKRQGNGLAIRTKTFGKTLVRAACSNKHSEMIMAFDRSGVTLSLDEKAALSAGGKAGGKYLESIGKFDLKTISKDEWSQFLEKILIGYCAHLSTQADEIPF